MSTSAAIHLPNSPSGLAQSFVESVKDSVVSWWMRSQGLAGLSARRSRWAWLDFPTVSPYQVKCPTMRLIDLQRNLGDASCAP